MKYHEQGSIVQHKQVGSDYYLMSIEAPSIAAEARPGQFVHLLCSEGLHPFLRRPISIFFAKEGEVGLLYKVVGEGTGLLSQKRVGETADLIGPLGTSFQDHGHERVLLVAGGIGIAPLVFLADTLDRSDKEVYAIYGAADRRDLVARVDLAMNCSELDVSTMNGSEGVRGTVLDVLQQRYGNGAALPQYLYACGPGAMLEALYSWMQEKGLPGQFSLENRMGCGIGACLGCVLPKRSGDGYLRICCDGPVFDAAEVQCQASLTE